ncbi:MAG: ABC transporter permease [Saccharofermentanales bacterium]|jgi:putative ABC transport system permease protein|nr:ABC transporter permease [Bacillota bacterium]
MTFFDLFRYGCINLWRRKSRTVLTALSMTIGVMCVIVLISVGLGYEATYRESIEQLGSLTKIDVTPADRTLLDKTALLNKKAVNAFKNIEGVEAVTPVVQKSAYIKCSNLVNMVRIYGIDVSTAGSFQIAPERGEAPGEGTRLRPDVMFTDDVAATFADAKNDWAAAVDADGNALIDPLAAKIKLTFDYSNLSGEQQADSDGRALPTGIFYTLNVTGICSTLNNTYSAAAFMDFDRLNELIDANSDYLGITKDEKQLAEEENDDPTYELVWIKVKKVQDVQRIAKLIRNSGLSVYSLNDMLETVRMQSRQIQGMLGAIGAVALLVSAIGVANTMMMSITERTKEIGILKVIGTPLGSISGMFLVEALILGILGGLFGLGLSYIAQKFLPVLFENMQVRSIIPAWLALAGVALAGVVALIAAFIPAQRAMRISVNAALRAE